MFIGVFIHDILIERIGRKPIDGREMAGKGQFIVKAPEYFHHAQRSLHHRFREVTAGRRHGADNGQGALAFLASLANNASGTFVETGDAGSKIGRIPLFTGHFFKAAGHLAHGFGPAAGGVGHKGHGIAHIAEIFCDGNPGEHGGFACRHGHIGRIRDQHGALHEGFARFRVFKFRELHQYVRHFIAAFAAAYIYHDAGIRPLGQLMLHHGLAATERSRNTGRSSHGQREEHV